MIQEELKKLPDKPGVYIMKNKYGEIIYVGKASILKNRVRQYFQPSSNLSPKIQAMVSGIADFEYIVTDSELEALILECTLIKKHKPRYNILLKDDKNYPYIKITMNDEYPRVLLTRKPEKDGAKYFGPYSNAAAVRETIDLLKRLFPIKTCSRVFPKDKVFPGDTGKKRPCLNYYIYRCPGPCRGDVNKEEYRALMKDICSFLNGKQGGAVERLEQQMKTAADNMDFERAASLRDKASSLRHISEKQKVLSTAMEDQDVVAFSKDRTDACVQVFFIREGKLIGREHFIFEGVDDYETGELMTSFIKQFYNSAAFVPGEVILQEDIDEPDIIENWLSGKRAARVRITVPRKGEKQQLVEMVSQNALIALKQFKDKIKNEKALADEGLKSLSEVLKLHGTPNRIEAYDISNTGISEIVGSMVVFEKGMPVKAEYRRFKVKAAGKQNDYGSMQEIVYRRFKHAEKERNEIETGKAAGKIKGKFTALPDLILVDGGLGHVNAVYEILREININIPVYGMVKDDGHRTRGLVTEEEEIDISKNLSVLRFVTAIQDEAHRFAIEYNRKLRGKRYTASALDEIGGIGPKRKKELIRHFGSVNGIKTAGLDDLLAVKGISKTAAGKIYDYFRRQALGK